MLKYPEVFEVDTNDIQLGQDAFTYNRKGQRSGIDNQSAPITLALRRALNDFLNEVTMGWTVDQP